MCNNNDGIINKNNILMRKSNDDNSDTVDGRNPAPLWEAYKPRAPKLILFEDTLIKMDLLEWRKSCTTC